MLRLLPLAIVAFVLPAAAAERPNFVVILVDDMGFSDIGCYGGEIPTPHIDALAAGGVSFRHFYNTGRCCPTRAALLTGQYAHVAGVGHMMTDRGPDHPAFRGRLNDRVATMAERLGAAGYATAAVGKWHVGADTPAERPNGRGFDFFYGVPEGGGFYSKVRKGRTVRRNDSVLFSATQPPPPDWYTTEAFTDEAIAWLDRFAGDHEGESDAAGESGDAPFLLYLPYNAPHFPLQAPQETIDRFRGRYRDGWDALRERRLERQRELGLFDETVTLPERPEVVPPWDTLSDEERDRFDHIMAIYAAVMVELDDAIGRLVAHLDATGRLGDTVILFLSDNGASAEGGDFGRLLGDSPGDADSSVYQGRAWATVSNTPLRRHKSSNHEGGIASPLIVHWPGGSLPSGAWVDQVGHVVDIVPTLLDLAGVDESAGAGDAVETLPGISLRKAMHGQTQPRTLFWSHQGSRAYREGDWKLVESPRVGRWELYDLATDPTEQQDQAASDAGRRKRMAAAWKRKAARQGFTKGEWTQAKAKKSTTNKTTNKTTKKTPRKATTNELRTKPVGKATD